MSGARRTKKSGKYIAEEVPFLRAALKHKCPKCGKGSIYAGVLKVRDKCRTCGFDLKGHDAGDGPAFFAMFITSIIILIAAMIAEFVFFMPLWLHLILWIPLTIVVSITFLRITKSILIALQYKHNILNFKDGGSKK